MIRPRKKYWNGQNYKMNEAELIHYLSPKRDELD